MRPVPRPNAPLLEIGAGAYIVRTDGRILFVEQERDGVRDWGCVGGGLEYGESIEECCVREAFEETGLRVRIKRLLAIDQFRLGDEMKGVGFLFLTEPDPWPQDVVLPEMDGRTRFHDHRWCSRDEYRALDLSRRSCASRSGRRTSGRRCSGVWSISSLGASARDFRRSHAHHTSASGR